MIELPHDFSEFLRLLGDQGVDHLLVGGYAVAHHGYPRATQDLDIWVAVHQANAERLVKVLEAFGFQDPALVPSLFLEADRIVRMGVAPMRVELLTSVDGVDFQQCSARAEVVIVNGVHVPVIALEDLKAAKRAAGRPKDLDDLENLP